MKQFHAGELIQWAETYGHPEEWAQKAKAAHLRAEEAERRVHVLADSLDRFFYDLGFTAPEATGTRINQLGARIHDVMTALGYPKKGPHAERPLAEESG